MKAAIIPSYGGSELLEVIEGADKPQATEGQVVVAVKAASVNPFDIKVLHGAVREMAELQFPAVLGGDFAGTVAEIGEGVSNFEIGQKVYGVAGALSSHGSFAEFTSVVSKQLSSMPETLDFAGAAAVPIVAASAYQALVDNMELTAGQKILIHGGAGGIGSVAIQIAKQIGAYVATTASASSRDFVKKLGADEIIDYTSTDFSTLLKDYDAVFDMVGGETFTKSLLVLKPGGIIVTMVEPADEAQAAESGVRIISQFTRATTERLGKIAELIDAGSIRVPVDTVYPLEQIQAAMNHLESGHPQGKIVIQINS